MNLDEVPLRRIDAGGVAIALREWGKGDPLVLIHGLGTHSGLWRYQAAEFGARFRVVALDLRGFGSSDRPTSSDAYRIDAFVDDVEAVLSSLRLGEVDCLGTSMGGFIAQSLALRRPKLVRRLVLAHTAACMTIPKDVLAARLAALRTTSMEEYGRLVAEQALGRGAQSPLFDWIARMVAANDRIVYERILTEGLRDFEARDRLGELRNPVLVVFGDSDRVIPAEASEDLAARIPGAEKTLLPGAGHIGYAEAPVSFNAAVMSFLTK